MKIIKQGKSKEELEKSSVRRFECKTCGCIFDANANEYECENDYLYITYFCKCPNCGDKATMLNVHF